MDEHETRVYDETLHMSTTDGRKGLKASQILQDDQRQNNKFYGALFANKWKFSALENKIRTKHKSVKKEELKAMQGIV